MNKIVAIVHNILFGCFFAIFLHVVKIIVFEFQALRRKQKSLNICCCTLVFARSSNPKDKYHSLSGYVLEKNEK